MEAMNLEQTTSILDETNEQYHKSPGVSFTGLKELAKTPAHYHAYVNRESEETSSQRLGTLCHMAVLEWERFKKTVVMIDGHRGKTTVKEEIAEAEMQGKYVCKPDEYHSAVKIAESIYKNDAVAKLLQGGFAEKSIRVTDPKTGVLLKCRPDYFREDGIVVDLKTFNDLSEEGISKQIYRMRYHWQSFHYLNVVNQHLGLKSNMFVHIFIDPETAISRVVVLDDASLEKAEFEMRPLIRLYAECLKNNNWPSYPSEIVTVALPNYAW